ncbi:MAG: TolC family protein [Planctomycetes bacterium]|nr:TolC family protein [Planctomycetota bacterium]
MPFSATTARPIALAKHEESAFQTPGPFDTPESHGTVLSGRPIGLSELKDLASRTNPTLAQAAAGVEAERGAYRQAGLYPNPQVGYLNNSASPSSVQQSNGAFISQEFVTANKLKLARIWEGHEVNRVAWEAEAQRVRVLNDLTIRYYEVLGAQEAVSVAENLEKLAQDGLATANSLLKNDLGTKNDVLQAEIQLETVRMSKHDAIFRQQAAWQQLANMIGDPQLPMSLVAGNLDGGVPDLEFDETWQELTANSPQLVASQANLDHARAELQLARAQVIPNVTLQTVLQRDNATHSSQASTLVSLPVPIFNRNQGNIQRAEADICAAEAEISRTRLVLRDLLADSFKRYQTSRHQALGYRDKILPNAEKSMEIASFGYKSGERGFLEVLTARQTYFQAKLASIEALTELRKVIVEIEGLQLTGGLNPAAIGTAIQSQPGGGTQRQRALLNQVQEGATRQLLPAAQLGR